MNELLTNEKRFRILLTYRPNVVIFIGTNAYIMKIHILNIELNKLLEEAIWKGILRLSIIL
ncbi:hypothetical protein JCM19376_36860 [Fusibacter bizertensis]